MGMESIKELTEYVYSKALMYLRETDETINVFPLSIVDFVIEYAEGGCHFPKNFTEKQIVSDLQKAKNAMAMACAEIFAKIGAEGETSHSENGVSRTYQTAWITTDLFANLPNYVDFL